LGVWVDLNCDGGKKSMEKRITNGEKKKKKGGYKTGKGGYRDGPFSGGELKEPQRREKIENGARVEGESERSTGKGR